MPSLTLSAAKFCDPDPNNISNTFRDAGQSYCFDLSEAGVSGSTVHAYTDLKRHVICDNSKPHYCNEPVSPVQASDSNSPIPPDQFLTAKLWDVGNSSPYGHRGDLDTIYAAIINHGGEALSSEAQFEALPDADQSAIVTFLKTLQMPIVPMKRNPPPQMAGFPNRWSWQEAENARLRPIRSAECDQGPLEQIFAVDRRSLSTNLKLDVAHRVKDGDGGRT